MKDVRFIEVVCKTALNRVRGMPFTWSLNPYRGCTHRCRYCYAMATHAYFGLGTDDFGSTIFVKTNLPEVSCRELSRSTWTNEQVAIGTATDPYQPCEGRYRITRSALHAFHERATPLGIVTKSTLVLRDLDVLASLARKTSVTVHFSLSTLDAAIWRLVEPGTPPPRKRLEVMERLVEAGVPCGVFLAPILPGITDSVKSIEAVVRAAKDHGATLLWSSTLRLDPLVKEHYYAFVRQAFPDLMPRYEQAYAGADAPRAYLNSLRARVNMVRAGCGFDQERGSGAPASQAVKRETTTAAFHQLSLAL